MQIHDTYLIIFPYHQLSFLQAMPACLRPNHRSEDKVRVILETSALLEVWLPTGRVFFYFLATGSNKDDSWFQTIEEQEWSMAEVDW